MGFELIPSQIEHGKSTTAAQKHIIITSYIENLCNAGMELSDWLSKPFLSIRMLQNERSKNFGWKTLYRIEPYLLVSGGHWPVKSYLRGSPLVSILDAVLTVSPKRQYRGIFRPTTPAQTGPLKSLRVFQDANFLIFSFPFNIIKDYTQLYVFFSVKK